MIWIAYILWMMVGLTSCCSGYLYLDQYWKVELKKQSDELFKATVMIGLGVFIIGAGTVFLFTGGHWN